MDKVECLESSWFTFEDQNVNHWITVGGPTDRMIDRKLTHVWWTGNMRNEFSGSPGSTNKDRFCPSVRASFLLHSHLRVYHPNCFVYRLAPYRYCRL